MAIDLVNTAQRFNVDGRIVSVEPYGFGLINRTYVALTDKGVRYILQRINSAVFQNVPALMKNIEAVTEFCADSLKQRGEEQRCLRLVREKESGATYVTIDGEYYRAYVFIEGATTYQKVQKKEHFYESGKALAQFQLLLSSFRSDLLTEVIPNFHNTAFRFTCFKIAAEIDALDRAKEVSAEIAFALNRKKLTTLIVDKLEEGKLPLRVTHNDTKFNNIMLDDSTSKAVCLIDFDTIMPGSALYDFGDAIRSGCNTAAENEKDLSKVHFSLDLFRAYTEGYLSVAGDFLTEEERNLLAESAIIMTFECGIRFLTDYLCGDTYFKINYPTENLDRARTQLRLVEEMERNLDVMKHIVNLSGGE